METKCGLVLSGGGAKGTYEAGVVKALAKLNFEPDVIAGASIGALNGAIVAASQTLADAAETLTAVWTGINEDEILKVNKLSLLRLQTIVAMNVVLRTALHVNPLALATYIASKPLLNKLFTEKDRKFIALLDSSPMEELLKNNLNFDRLLGTEGKEFYVSVCPSKGGEFWGTVRDVLRYATNAGESLFPRLKDFDKDDAVRLVLASAAIPPALKAVMIQEKTYRDGGMGKRIEQQGNTPMKPLADIGCKCAIVVMLSQGSLWNRNEWPDIVPIEIRPSFDINEGSMSLSDDFIVISGTYQEESFSIALERLKK